MAAVTRRQYKGAAAQTTITNALASGDTSATLAATTGWPSGAEPFFVVISPGTASEEKCSATISGSVLTLTRAQDDTTAQSHASGATIYPVFSADDADEANFLASRWTTKGDIVAFDGTDVARLGVGIDGYRVTAASGETTGLKYDMPSVPVFATSAARDAAFGGTGEKVLAEGQVCYRVAAPKNLQVYNGSAWIPFDISENSYTPTLTNVTLGNGTINGVYQRIGAYCVFGFHLSFGSTTSVSGLIGISIPFTADTGANTRHWLNVGFSDTGTTQYNGIGTIDESGTRVNMYAILASGTYTTIAGSPTSATVPHTWATTDEIFGSSIYRMA